MELWKTVPEGARETIAGEHCPKCSSNRIHRSRTRGGFEAAVKALTPLRPFKCSECKWRGLRVAVPFDGHTRPLPPPEDKSPSRRSRRPSGKKKGPPSPKTRARRQLFVQVLTTLAIAVLTGLAVGMCHGRG